MRKASIDQSIKTKRKTLQDYKLRNTLCLDIRMPTNWKNTTCLLNRMPTN